MPMASIADVAAVLAKGNWGRSIMSLRVLRRKRVYGHHPGQVQDERANAANRDRRRRGVRELGVAGHRWARSISLAEAVVLVARVNDAAMRGARESLEALIAPVAVSIAGIAIRVCPKRPRH